MSDSPTVITRVVLWPTRGGTIPTGEDPLGDASDEERQFFAQYADVTLLELWRRLRTAEWNAAYRQEEIERLLEQARRLPPLSDIREMDARHKRVRALLDVPQRRSIPRAELRAALDDRVEYPITFEA